MSNSKLSKPPLYSVWHTFSTEYNKKDLGGVMACGNIAPWGISFMEFTFPKTGTLCPKLWNSVSFYSGSNWDRYA